uniref:Uncharacterized protein n=1 Tax=Arundo donax TaxID=35708 RepID=A0A0A9FWL3_ARUDO
MATITNQHRTAKYTISLFLLRQISFLPVRYDIFHIL